MHESSLAKQILDAVLAVVPDELGSRLRSVRGWVAETEQLDADALELHFHAHARGTRAEGAELELRLTHVKARCLACGSVYAPEHHLTLCPDCGATEAALLGQTGLGIESIDVEDLG